MTTRWNVTVDMRRLDLLIVRVPDIARSVINRTAIAIQADATLNTERVDTGAMKSGWMVQLAGGGSVGGDTLPAGAETVEIPAGGDNFANVGDVMEYAYYWEVGHRGFAPELMLSKAVEKNRSMFERELSEAYNRFGIE